MSERLTRRVAALESNAGATDRKPIEIITRIWAPGPSGPVLLRELAEDGTVLREYEHPVPPTEPEEEAP